MRVSREQMKEHRERVLAAAAELFRERGLAGVGVAEIMEAAGMTHGGFYRHFDSKDDLAAEACGRAFDDALERLERKRADLARYTDSYLTERHRDQPGGGCPIACFVACRPALACGRALIPGRLVAQKAVHDSRDRSRNPFKASAAGWRQRNGAGSG